MVWPRRSTTEECCRPDGVAGRGRRGGEDRREDERRGEEERGGEEERRGEEKGVDKW